ncbi:ketosynthase chain-length factor [Streptomyces sp. NPDC006193]|uniref:ketosynthase chain-length factor n=1 Tax=Streptomyces sp. NPDC006193 TaxID=3155717 RepID=UPI0033B73309
MTAVITGIGITAPTGIGAHQHWQATLAGHNAITPITHYDTTHYPTRLAGQITDYNPADHLPGRLLPQTDRMTQLALTAADLALTDAGLTPDDLDPHTTAVVTAAAAGGFEFGQRELQALWSKGPQHVSAYQSFAWFYAVNTGQLSIRHNTRGPSNVIVTEQAGGLDALAIARRHIKRGIKTVITGGTDAPLSPWALAAQTPNGRLTPTTDPHHAYRPYHPHANGYVPGEGGAILIIEDEHTARRRNAHIYAHITGHHATFDAHPHHPHQLTTAIQGALHDAHLTPHDIDVIFTDAAATPTLDQQETQAITHIFGPHTTPVTAPKTMTGRLYSGGATLDTATALLTLHHHTIPPTINTHPAPHHPIDLVTTPRPHPTHHALILARGHHGFNTALILTHPHHNPH